jgi:hypothetical protein
MVLTCSAGVQSELGVALEVELVVVLEVIQVLMVGVLKEAS